nr:FGGY family carbohydrate kinase [Maliibacterium massiliense]
MKIIALDIGSSFTKSAIMDTASGALLSKTRMPTPARLDTDDPTRFEVDADLIYDTVTQLIDAQLAQTREIGGIFFSIQMHGYILSRGLEAVTPYVSWQDAYADKPRPEGSHLARLQQLLGPDAVASMGTRYKSGIAACSLYARQQQHPIALEGLRFHTLGGYLIYRMSGGKAHACHLTSAAATGFADAPRGVWNARTIRLTGCDALTFPAIVPADRPLGSYRGVPLYCDIGDHQASVYGAGDDLASAAIITIGTAGIVCAVAPGFVHADMEVRPFFDEHCLMTITRQPGGRVVDVIIDLIQDAVCTVTDAPCQRQEIWRRL